MSFAVGGFFLSHIPLDIGQFVVEVEMQGFTVVEARPGSLTLGVVRLKGNEELARRVVERFTAVDGIRAVRADAAAGTVQVEYDRERLRSWSSLWALKSAFQELFPEVDSLALASWLAPHLG